MQSTDSGIAELMVGKRLCPNPPGAPKGLYIILDWIDEATEQQLVNFLAAGTWSDHISGKRPTQHFGYRYTLNGYSSSTEKLATDWGALRPLADRIEHEFPGIKIAQCLANLYFKDTTIGAHRDKETPVVFGISLVGDTNMIWTHIRDKSLKYEAFVPRRSMYIMCDDAAFDWMHAVPSRKRVNYPDANGQLNRTVDKPEWYTRLSITYRHFNHAVVGPDRLSGPIHSPAVPALEACHLKTVIPRYLENEPLLFQEHPWTTFQSRFGGVLSRKVCPESHLRSRTSAIYGIWVQLFCDRILGVKVIVQGCFANLYPSGTATLPAHRDSYGLVVFGLSFGETRTFDFISNGVSPTAKTTSKGEIISMEVESGDIVLFSNRVNDTHKHRILPEPSRKGRRINLTYFIQVLSGQQEAKLYNPPPIDATKIPSFEEAAQLFESTRSNSNNSPQTGGKEYIIEEDMETGALFLVTDNGPVPIANLEELFHNLGNY